MSADVHGPHISPMSMLDRGDAPAQAVIDKTTRAKAKRRADETQEELDKIKTRVEKTIDAFELSEKFASDNKAAILVPDLIELEKIISDAITKKKYQQEVVVFIVGYEDNCTHRAKLLSQLNDFFVSTINTYDEDELMPKRKEVDLDEISSSIQTALDTAENATQKLSEINHEMVTYVQTLTGGKGATKSKKKLEKALQQAKDDIQSLTDKLLGAQTEIEDKEDKMTMLYKQIDVKNMEIQKQKAQTEVAREKLKQIDELKLVISAKEDEIDGWRKKVADVQLHMQQVEQSREASQAKLRASNEDNQNLIDKLQSKLTQALVALEDTKTELKKEHDTVVRDLQKRHRDDIVALKNEYEEKIRQLEEEELERVKHWESDSEDDDRISSRRSNLDGSFSRKSSRWDRRTPLQLPPLRSGYTTPLPPPTPQKTMDSSPFPSRLNTPKRNGTVTPLFNDMSPLMASGPTSPQPLSPLPDVVMVSKDTPGSLGKKKSDQLSRQSTKLSDKQGSSDSMKAPTPKQPSRAKSNLETVQEVPFDEKIPLEDEERWSNLPTEKLRGGFKQFRTESLLLVTSLQNEIKTQKEDTTKRYNKLKSQYKDHQKKWDAERQVLTDQVDQSQRLQAEAEKEADEAMMQLEAFIADHEKQPKEQPQEQAEKQAAEDQESKKELKKLTPEQREMLNLGNNSNAKTPETKHADQVEDETQTTPLPVVDHSQQTSRTEMYRDLSHLLPTASSLEQSLTRQTAPSVAATDKATGAPSEVPTEEDSRPQTPSSQIDLVNKLKAQMEERRAERQSRATSMHGSLLSAKSRTETATTDDAPFPEDEEAGGDAEVELIDTATSPMTIRSAASSRKSVSIVDHPVVQEYLNTYQVVQDFKEKLVKILQDKELMSHATRLEDIPIVEFDPDRMVHVQVSEMKENTERALREISDILSTLIENEMDPRVSSLSRGLTAQTITTQQSQPTVLETEPEVQREASNVTFETEAIVKELQEALEKLKEEQKKEKKVYEEQLNHNAVVMMEMQDMITELQRELAVAGSTARYGSTLASREQKIRR
ncbi:myosin-1B-like isoform X2 [Ptychodera flava]|uniref:myosin-1B-like isoform X2 n=1 Tax=Ptychodera flava TaxID=63121 RepID=UPI00396A1994